MNRQIYLEVNKGNFKYNVESIRAIVGDKEICPVIKANAYGTYINNCLDLIEDFKIVGVAIVSEAITLRKIGYLNDILVLNQPYLEDIDNVIDNNVIVGVCSFAFLKELSFRKEKIKIHIELETGMGRTGFKIEELNKLVKLLSRCKNILVEGVYTHFAVADIDKKFTTEQIDKFFKGVQYLKDRFDSIKYVHCSASNGILNYKIDFTNMVRAGIIMYGYPSFLGACEKIDLKPCTRLIAKISYIKDINKGDSISYGRTFIANSKMRIATVGIGYADGIRRNLSNKGEVVINGVKCLIVGAICMDSFMVDVSGIDCEIGDEVFLWDNELITLEDVSEKCGTINYEILSTISDRVPRKFID